MVSTISVRLRKWSEFLFLYLRRLAIAAWRISLFVRLAQRYALYLLAVEQPAAGTMEVLIALGDVDRYVEHDGGRYNFGYKKYETKKFPHSIRLMKRCGALLAPIGFIFCSSFDFVCQITKKSRKMACCAEI